MPYGKFDPPSDQRIPDIATAEPFGRSPDGHWIVSVHELPLLPIPAHVFVTRVFIEFDGWVFPLSYVSKSLLIWLQASFIRWAKDDGTKRNSEWIQGIADALQYALAGEL